MYQLDDLGLPIDPWWQHDGGLAFDLLSSYTTGEKVIIGHADGVITIDVVETLDAYREQLRVRLGEPYRTMLGHFRHEVGHYYQNILVENGPGAQRYLDECRALFGDERASYADGIDRHYKFGAPDDWQASFISEYATMHPWEDFAECFAHYLHITDTIDTAREAGHGAARRPGTVQRPARRGAAGVLRRSPDRTSPLRLEMDVDVLQPDQHLDGETAVVPVRVPTAGGRQTGLRAQGRA